MTFYEYMKTELNDQGPVGDLARDVLQDPHFPRDLSSLEELREYLRDKGADWRVLEAADNAWAEYLVEVLR